MIPLIVGNLIGHHIAQSTENDPSAYEHRLEGYEKDPNEEVETWLNPNINRSRRKFAETIQHKLLKPILMFSIKQTVLGKIKDGWFVSDLQVPQHAHGGKSCHVEIPAHICGDHLPNAKWVLICRRKDPWQDCQKDNSNNTDKWAEIPFPKAFPRKDF